jgi:hypothetical protein
MTALLEFQRTLARAVMQPLSARDNMKLGRGRGKNCVTNPVTNPVTQDGVADGVALVKPNSRLSSWERLEIYNRSYWSRVLDAFGEDFPGVRALLGARQFERLRRSYLADCPSESFTMRNLGKKLAAWMEQNPSLAGGNQEIALEMAKLEWAHIESFDAAEYERLSPTDIAALAPDSGLRLQPHLRLMVVEHEVDRLLLEVRESAKRHGGVPRTLTRKGIARAKSAGSSGALSANPSANPLYLAIHRFELVVHYKRLDAEMFRLVSALAKGLPMGDAIESAYSESRLTQEESQQHIQSSFALFSALGWFCKSSPQAGEEL